MSREVVKRAWATTAELAAMTPEAREFIVNTDRWSIVIGDGFTLGGAAEIRPGGPGVGYTAITPTNAGSGSATAKQKIAVFLHTGTISTFSFSMPPSPLDGDRFSIFTRSAITTLTLTSGTGGSTIIQSSLSPIAGARMDFLYVNSGSINRWFGGN